MKKIFTLLAGILLTAAVFAADHRPMVTISSAKNYKIVVDGRAYFGSQATIKLANLRNGMHTIQVFEMRRGYFVKGQRLVSSSSFRVARKDVRILVDHFGRITVFSRKNMDPRFDRHNDRDDRDGDWDRDNDYRYDNRDHEPVRRF